MPVTSFAFAAFTPLTERRGWPGSTTCERANRFGPRSPAQWAWGPRNSLSPLGS